MAPGAGTNAYAVPDRAPPAAVFSGVHVVCVGNMLKVETEACDTGPDAVVPTLAEGTKSWTADLPTPDSGGTDEDAPPDVDVLVDEVTVCGWFGTTTDDPVGSDDNISNVFCVSTTPSTWTRLNALSVRAFAPAASVSDAGFDPVPDPNNTAAAAVVTTAPAAVPARPALPTVFDTRDALFLPTTTPSYDCL
ncbi:hypothetical protein GCM10009619_21010 [Williamsia maris]